MKYLLIIIILIHIGNESATGQNCGVERWAVKTLSDPDTSLIDFNNMIPTTIAEQAAFRYEQGGSRSRLPSEQQVYSLVCAIVGFKHEADQDIHIIVEDTLTEQTMVVEMISPACMGVQGTARYEQIKELYTWFVMNIGNPSDRFTFLRKHIPITLTGVGFFDFCHGQKGTLENCREIHPVLSINIL